MLGPVFRHEMLAAGRKRRFFVYRALVGLGMLLLLGLGYAAVSESMRYLEPGGGSQAGLSIASMSRLSATFYGQFAWATMLGVLAVTPAVVAGAVATERERRTIEYLFATDLSNAEIILDKLVARLLTVGKLVLATLPVLAIFRLLGGVPGELLLLQFVMLASAAILTAAISLLVGVWCERSRDAVPRAMGAVFLWLIALPMAFMLQAWIDFGDFSWGDAVQEWVLRPVVIALAAFHPLIVLMTSAGVGGGVLGVDIDYRAIAMMVASQLAVAAVLVAIAVALVRRVHLAAASSPGAPPKATAAVAALRSPYDKRPMLWKEMFAASVKKPTRKWARRLGYVVLLMIVAGPLVGMLGATFFGSGGFSFNDYQSFATGIVATLGSLLVLAIGSRAAGLITYEHERDTWLSLLTTPLPGPDVVSAKTWGNLYAYRWPLAGAVAVPLLGALLDVRAVFAAMGVALALGALAWAATAIGLAVSLRMKSSVKAVGVTVFVLLGIGLFLPMLMMAFAGLIGLDFESIFLTYAPLAPFLLALPCIAVNESGPDEIAAAYFAGVVFYAALGFFVNANSKREFDRICDRAPELTVRPDHQRLASQVASAS